MIEASVSPVVSSQQDMVLDMSNEPFLGSFSQQDDTIEVRHRGLTICTESSTIPLLIMRSHLEEATQDTSSAEHLVTVPTIVTVEVPS